MPLAVNKYELTKRVGRRLNYQFSKLHLRNVVALFLDEFVQELKIKKVIYIPNFCFFSIKKSEPRLFHNIQTHKVMKSKGKQLLKIRLASSLRRLVINKIDIVKTFL